MKCPKTIAFDMKANSMEETYDWCTTHDFKDAGNESAYWDADYSESVSELEYNEFVAIDISK